MIERVDKLGQIIEPVKSHIVKNGSHDFILHLLDTGLYVESSVSDDQFTLFQHFSPNGITQPESFSYYQRLAHAGLYVVGFVYFLDWWKNNQGSFEYPLSANLTGCTNEPMFNFLNNLFKKHITEPDSTNYYERDTEFQIRLDTVAQDRKLLSTLDKRAEWVLSRSIQAKYTK